MYIITHRIPKKKIIEVYPELDYNYYNINSITGIPTCDLGQFLTQSKVSLRLYNRMRVFKRSTNKYQKKKKGILKENQNNVTQLILIKKYAGTHRHRSGKKYSSKVYPVIFFDRKYFCWYKISGKKNFNEIVNEMLE